MHFAVASNYIKNDCARNKCQLSQQNFFTLLLEVLGISGGYLKYNN